VSGSGISWAICKSAPRSRQITTPAPHRSVFTGRMPFLPPNHQCQSTEGTYLVIVSIAYYASIVYFALAAVTVHSSHMTVPSSASWSRFSPGFVNWHVSTMWFMVCRWQQSQKGDWARPHLCKLARHGP